MMIIAIVVGCIAGVGLGFLIPTIPYTASQYLAIAIVAALDTVFGGLHQILKKNFDMKVFISGFCKCNFSNAFNFFRREVKCRYLFSSDCCFVGRMFNNLGIIRRHYLGKITKRHGSKEEIKGNN